MLKKIISIENVGTFRRCKAAGDVELAKATLLYAPNARGKTTLCDVFRSVQVGDGSALLGRHSVAAAAEPAVALRFDSETVRFENGSWSAVRPEFEVYDSRFVHDNVHAGEAVGHDQRVNLYEIIIGEAGVKLSERASTASETLRQAKKDEKQAVKAVEAFIPEGGMSLKGFVALEKDERAAERLERAEKKLAALRAATELKRKPLLIELGRPSLPDGIAELLNRRLESVAEDAEETIRTHMSKHMTIPDEQWLARGYELKREEICPFCAQDLSPSSMIAAYRTQFAGEYKALKRDVKGMMAKVRASVPESSKLEAQQTLTKNATIYADWSKYAPLDELPILDLDAAHDPVMTLRDTALRLLEQKEKAPLDPVVEFAALDDAEARAKEAGAVIDIYNGSIRLLNGSIRATQDSAAAEGLKDASVKRARLLATQARHSEEGDRLCVEYEKARAVVATADLDVQQARQELREHSESVFQRYQDRINKHLKGFGASFRIAEVSESHRGGKKASTSYSIALENTQVPLGDANTPLTERSFKNTLSSGDKSALALAFFLAKLDGCDLRDKIVVFDDPFSSQDVARQTVTQQAVCRIAKAAKQVIVLSHDPRFLKWVSLGMGDVSCKALQISHLGDATISEWRIEDVVHEYVALYRTVLAYCTHNEGKPQLVAKTLRPLLEGFLRLKLPDQFADNEWLGDYIKHIQSAEGSSPLVAAQGAFLDELIAINDYSKRHHHFPGNHATEEAVVPAELITWAQRTLDLVRGF